MINKWTFIKELFCPYCLQLNGFGSIQIYRNICMLVEFPKNLQKTLISQIFQLALIDFVYKLLYTSLCTMLFPSIISSKTVGDYSGAITVCKLETSGVKFITTLKVISVVPAVTILDIDF